MSKACIFLADGFEEIEGLTVVDILRRAGITVDVVSVTGDLNVTSAQNVIVVADRLLNDRKTFQKQNFLYCREVCQERRIWEHAKH